MKLLSLVGFSLLSTLAGATREECYETLQGDDFTEYFNGIEEAAFEDIPTLCSDIGGDFFSFSGPISCETGYVPRYFNVENQTSCLPTVCTDDEDLMEGILVEMVTGFIYPECLVVYGTFEYDGLGDGAPQSIQCSLDLIELSEGQVMTNFLDAINDDVAEVYDNEECWPEPITCEAGQIQCSGHYGPGGDGNELLDEDLKWCCDSCNCKDLNDRFSNGPQCEAGQNQCYGHYGPGGDGNELVDKGLKWCCDSCNCKDLGDSTDILDSGDDAIAKASDCTIKYTNAARVCEENDGMDFFTYSRTTLINATIFSNGTIDEETDVPSCFPSSCTSDEEALKHFLLPEFPKNGTYNSSFVFTDIGPNSSDDNGPVICMDPPNQVKFMTSEMKRKNCAWARKKAKKRCDSFPEIMEGCPMTCGGCDSTEKFLLEDSGVQKSCEWAKRKKTNKRCRKSPTSEMCPSVCKSWPSIE